jgi:tRNA threonylcarbamoyladenosine biosynthesis protein TsaB
VRILAVETSGFSGSVAAADGQLLLGEITLLPRQRTGQALAPAIHDLLNQVGWKPTDVQLVAVTQGPGSFTGLRVGVTTAKTFAYAVGAEAIGVDTLEVLAAQIPTTGLTLSAVMDAEREQLFAATFASTDAASWTITESTKIISRSEWIQSLPPDTIVTGTGLESLAEILPPHLRPASAELWRPQAAAVARIGWRDYQSGRRDDVWKLLPNYFRESAAVEKLQR